MPGFAFANSATMFFVMKLTSVLVLSLASALMVGCGKNEPAPSSGQTTTPSTAPKGPRQIVISGGDNMKFDVTSIQAAPGEELTLVFKNVGSMPKDVMGHNLVLLAKGTDVTAFSNAAMMAKATEYIPANLAAQVIAHTKLLGPKQSDTLVIKAPVEPGDYPFVCSFPGHYAAGMKGILTVK